MTARMQIKGVKRVWSEKARKTYYYHRKSGKRIKAEYGTAEFAVEVDRLNRQWAAKTDVKGTFGHLVDKYRETPEFKRLKPITKADYEAVFTALKDIRAMPLSAFNREFVYKLRNRAFAKHKRRFANYVVQVVSRTFTVGRSLGLVQDNPAFKVEKIRKATGEGNRNRPWTSAERDAVLEAAPIQLKAPLAFMRYFGARLGDVRRMENDAYRDGAITFVTGKGDVEVTLPVPPPLAAILSQRIPHKKFMFVTSEGTPWTEGGWNASFRKLRERVVKAGQAKPGLTAHGLRHSVATDLREMGFTDRQIADVLGQKTTYATPAYHRTADMRRSNAKVMAELHKAENKTEGA